MAKVIVNPKGFKVIKTTMFECLTWGGAAICDHCNQSAHEGYFVSVLNHWVCPKCYKEWYNSAEVYQEDKHYERVVFNRYCRLLKVDQEKDIVHENTSEPKPIKVNWNREEVIKLLKSMPNFFNNSIDKQIELRNQWIEENL